MKLVNKFRCIRHLSCVRECVCNGASKRQCGAPCSVRERGEGAVAQRRARLGGEHHVAEVAGAAVRAALHGLQPAGRAGTSSLNSPPPFLTEVRPGRSYGVPHHVKTATNALTVNPLALRVFAARSDR